MNKKLTGILQGRTVTAVDWEGAAAIVRFDDGSAMTVQTAAAGAAGTAPGLAPCGPPAMGRVRAVRQQDTTLNLDFEAGTTLTLRTAEATSSVLLRARDHSLEYAD